MSKTCKHKTKHIEYHKAENFVIFSGVVSFPAMIEIICAECGERLSQSEVKYNTNK